MDLSRLLVFAAAYLLYLAWKLPCTVRIVNRGSSAIMAGTAVTIATR